MFCIDCIWKIKRTFFWSDGFYYMKPVENFKEMLLIQNWWEIKKTVYNKKIILQKLSNYTETELDNIENGDFW